MARLGDLPVCLVLCCGVCLGCGGPGEPGGPLHAGRGLGACGDECACGELACICGWALSEVTCWP